MGLKLTIATYGILVILCFVSKAQDYEYQGQGDNGEADEYHEQQQQQQQQVPQALVDIIAKMQADQESHHAKLELQVGQPFEPGPSDKSPTSDQYQQLIPPTKNFHLLSSMLGSSGPFAEGFGSTASALGVSMAELMSQMTGRVDNLEEEGISNVAAASNNNKFLNPGDGQFSQMQYNFDEMLSQHGLLGANQQGALVQPPPDALAVAILALISNILALTTTIMLEVSSVAAFTSSSYSLAAALVSEDVSLATLGLGYEAFGNSLLSARLAQGPRQGPVRSLLQQARSNFRNAFTNGTLLQTLRGMQQRLRMAGNLTRQALTSNTTRGALGLGPYTVRLPFGGSLTTTGTDDTPPAPAQSTSRRPPTVDYSTPGVEDDTDSDISEQPSTDDEDTPGVGEEDDTATPAQTPASNMQSPPQAAASGLTTAVDDSASGVEDDMDTDSSAVLPTDDESTLRVDDDADTATPAETPASKMQSPPQADNSGLTPSVDDNASGLEDEIDTDTSAETPTGR